MKQEIIALTRDQIKKMTIEEMESRIDILNHVLTGIEFQINTAKENFLEKGEIVPGNWMARATAKRKIINNERQILTKMISARRKELNQLKQFTIDRIFIEIAKKRLDKDLFMEICKEAEREAGKLGLGETI